MKLFSKDKDTEKQEFTEWKKQKENQEEEQRLKKEAEEKQKQKEQLEETENVDSYEFDENQKDISLIDTVVKFANDNGISEAMSQLDYIKNELFIQDIITRLVKEEDKETVQEYGEVPFTEAKEQ